MEQHPTQNRLLDLMNPIGVLINLSSIVRVLLRILISPTAHMIRYRVVAGARLDNRTHISLI